MPRTPIQITITDHDFITLAQGNVIRIYADGRPTIEICLDEDMSEEEMEFALQLARYYRRTVKARAGEAG